MSEPTVRAAIKVAIEGVSNIGLVYDRPRYSNLTDDFRNLYTTTISSSTVIRAWTIRVTDIPQEGFVTTGSRDTALKRTYTYLINGYLQFDDSNSSEITVTALALAVMDALDDKDLFVDKVMVVEPVQATLGYDDLGGVLVHLVSITLNVSETV